MPIFSSQFSASVCFILLGIAILLTNLNLGIIADIFALFAFLMLGFTYLKNIWSRFFYVVPRSH